MYGTVKQFFEKLKCSTEIVIKIRVSK